MDRGNRAIIICVSIFCAGVLTALSGCSTAQGQNNNGNNDGSVEGGDGNQNRSGDRIKMRVAHTEDGADAIIGWYDDELDVECSFDDDSDGILRCLPTYLASITYYSDSNCTHPLAHVSTCSYSREDDPKYAKLYECDSSESLFWKITGTTDPSKVYLKVGSDCDEYPIPDDTEFFTISAISINEFQPASVSIN